MAIFQSLWVGEPLSPYQRLAMKSFIDHCHQFHLYTYEPFDLPNGVERRDARDVLPEAGIFRQHGSMGRASYGGFSDLFRYRLLSERGGWWVDTDVICMADDLAEPEVFFGWQDDKLINGAILRFPAGHALPATLCRLASEKGREFAWGAIGPHLLTRVIRGQDIERKAAPARLAYPVHWREAMSFLLPAKAQEVWTNVGAAPLVHLWHEMIRQGGVLQWAGPPAGSFLADLFARHDVPIPEPVYSGDEMARLARNLGAAIRLDAAEKVAKQLAAEVEALRAERDRLAAAAPGS